MRLIDKDYAVDTAWSIDAYHGSAREVCEMLEDAPEVEAEPVRHGKWARENNYGIWKCSECGCKVNRSNPLKGNIWNYYYCPNCGAKMERKEE